MEIRDRVALVTGSARRLGRAIAAGLARRGAHVAVHYHASRADAEEAAREFESWGVRSRVYGADLRDPRQIERLFRQVESDFGGLDVLVNSAGILERRPLLEITPEDWDRVLELNLRAPFFCAQQAARLMETRGGGKIINVSDLAAHQPWTGYAHHSVSKAGLEALTRVLARALAPEIQVNAIAPGSVLPPEDWGEEERAALIRRTALKRLGSPDDVVRAVDFLLESDYVTGATVIVDGGRLLTS
jgi:NAD(P)-dependent dehydrogenase (short-subunit alcohol dehydrogenase family)